MDDHRVDMPVSIVGCRRRRLVVRSWLDSLCRAALLVSKSGTSAKALSAVHTVFTFFRRVEFNTNSKYSGVSCVKFGISI
jgi:hypothetical protein